MMKKRGPILVLVAVLGGLVALVWLKPEGPEEESARATEVAVHVGKVTRTTLRGYVTVYGRVEPEPAGERPAASAHVAPAVPGVIAEVHCAEGQRTAKGDVLFKLDSRAADVAVTFAEQTLERQQKLAHVDGTSQKSLQEAQRQVEAARVQQALLRVESPLSGTVTRVNVKPGEAVDLSTVLADVVDLERLVVSASVPSHELTELQVGQPARVLADRATQPVPASLTYIGAEVDEQSGTAVVRALLPSDSGLRPGELVTVRIVSSEHRDCLAVPVESVVKNEDDETVVSLVQGDAARQMRVKTGLRDGGWVEVEADGLRPDALVVTEGAYALPEETRVRVLGN